MIKIKINKSWESTESKLVYILQMMLSVVLTLLKNLNTSSYQTHDDQLIVFNLGK
jgi:hypothetical protein